MAPTVKKEEDPNQYIANLTSGSWCGFKYFFFHRPSSISLKLRGNGKGIIEVRTSFQGEKVASVVVSPSSNWSDFSANLDPIEGKAPLYFTFEGAGHVDFFSFELK
jgi:Carbohydrate binding module (family 6).